MTPDTTSDRRARGARGRRAAARLLRATVTVLLAAACATRDDDPGPSAPFSREAMSDTAAARERSVRARVAGDSAAEPIRVPITAAETNAQPTPTAIPSVDEGRKIRAVQIMLDRARFSTGALDGIWGENTRKAVQWFQRAHHLDTTGIVEQVTFDRLQDGAGADALVGAHRVTDEDLQGPFAPVPA